MPISILRLVPFFLSNLHTYLARATQLMNWVRYGGVPALHTVVDVTIKCPSGLLFAYFLALHFFIIVPCLEQAFGEELYHPPDQPRDHRLQVGSHGRAGH